MVDDPTGPNAVAGFGEYGCYKTCHDNSRAMPEWDPSTDLTKYLNDGEAGSLDLWHHRLHRANPIGASDDQFVSTIPVGRGGENGFRSARFLEHAGEDTLQQFTHDGNKMVVQIPGGGIASDQPSSPHLLIPETQSSMLHCIAGNDDEGDPEVKNRLREGYAAAGLSAEIEVYAGTMHGWCPPDSQVYNEASAERAWSRLLNLFEGALA